jgi:hypothetical protein
MTNVFGKEFRAALAEIVPVRQGRSKKKLREDVKYEGGIYFARFEGRVGRCFGATREEALHYLRGTR